MYKYLIKSPLIQNKHKSITVNAKDKDHLFQVIANKTGLAPHKISLSTKDGVSHAIWLDREFKGRVIDLDEQRRRTPKKEQI